MCLKIGLFLRDVSMGLFSYPVFLPKRFDLEPRRRGSGGSYCALQTRSGPTLKGSGVGFMPVDSSDGQHETKRTSVIFKALVKAD